MAAVSWRHRLSGMQTGDSPTSHGGGAGAGGGAGGSASIRSVLADAVPPLRQQPPPLLPGQQKLHTARPMKSTGLVLIGWVLAGSIVMCLICCICVRCGGVAQMRILP